MASSNVSGWSEIGFAFGMGRPPMVTATAHSSADTSSEHASAAACSAFCYHVAKDVGILAVIVSIGELREIQRQIVFAYFMECADHATFQQAPEAIQVRRMDIPAHILTLPVVHNLVRELAAQSRIAWMFVRRHQRNVLTDRIPHKVAQRQTVGILDNLADHVAFTGDSPDHGDFIVAPAMIRAFLARVTVPVLASEVGLVYFNLSHELGKASILHGSADAMAHIPGRPIGSAADDPLNLQGAYALLATQHQVDHLKPGGQRIVRILKDRLGNHGKPVAVASAAVLALADPMKWAAFHGKDLGIVAAWARHAIRPTALLQKGLARRFILKAIHQASECLGFHFLASSIVGPVYRSSTVVSSGA